MSSRCSRSRSGCRRGEPFEFGRRLRVPPGLEQQLEPVLEGAEPQLLQPDALGGRPLRVADVGERRPAPERQRLVERRSSAAAGVAGDGAGARQQSLEPDGVDRVGIDCQPVARRLGDQHVAGDAGGGQRPAQLRDPQLQRIGGVGGQVLAPEGVGEGVDGDDPAGREGQPGEQRAHGRRQLHGHAAGGAHLDGAEHPERRELHTCSTQKAVREFPPARPPTLATALTCHAAS